MSYKLVIVKSLSKSLKKLPAPIAKAVCRCIDLLALNPRPPGAKKLKDQHSIYRIRIGDYRVIYRVEDSELVIYVLRAAHRREVYRVT